MKSFKQYISEGIPNTRLGDLYTSWQHNLQTNPITSVPSEHDLRLRVSDKIINSIIAIHNHPKTPKAIKKFLGPVLDLTFDKYLGNIRSKVSNVQVPSHVPGEYHQFVAGVPHSPVLASSMFQGRGSNRGFYSKDNKVAYVNPYDESDEFAKPNPSAYDFISTMGHEISHASQDERIRVDPENNKGLKHAQQKIEDIGVAVAGKKPKAFEKYVTHSYETRPRIEGAIAVAAKYKKDTGKFIPFEPPPESSDKFASFSHPVMTDMENTPGFPPKNIRASRKKAILQAAKKAYGKIATKEQEQSGKKINPQQTTNIFTDLT